MIFVIVYQPFLTAANTRLCFHFWLWKKGIYNLSLLQLLLFPSIMITFQIETD